LNRFGELRSLAISVKENSRRHDNQVHHPSPRELDASTHSD